MAFLAFSVLVIIAPFLPRILTGPTIAVAIAQSAPPTPPRRDTPVTVSPAVEIPKDAGVINMQSVGAVGDGVTDNTVAIAAAIQSAPQNAILYFPNGTYLISSPLLWQRTTGVWRAYLTLQGESQAGTIIKLKDNLGGAWASPGNCANSYSINGIHPDCRSNAMIYTGSEGVTTSDSNGNEGYNNYIFDLTFDIGSGNPGAEAIHWIGHNSSSIRNVTITSDDGQGFIGLDMRTQYFGPALAKNVTIEGFQYGMAIDQAFSSVTMEHITLRNQMQAGFQLMQNVASIRDLVSTNSVPVVTMTGPAALVLINAQLSGGSNANPAINFQSPGQVYLRNIASSGYHAVAVENGVPVAGGSPVNEYSSSYPVATFSTAMHSLALPIVETPEYSDNNFANWANVKNYGAIGNGTHDDAPAIQAAIDSGKTTVYLPFGTYYIGSSIVIRGNLCLLRGFGATLTATSGTYRAIKVQNTSCPIPAGYERGQRGGVSAVTIDQLNGGGSGFLTPEIEGASSATLVLKDIRLLGYTTTNGWNGGGNVFLEDVSFGPYYFNLQNVWAHQLDPETRLEHVVNDGGFLWVLGLKTENPGSQGVNPSTILESRAGSRSEVLGGYASTQNVPNGTTIVGNINCNQAGGSGCPMFISNESTMSIFLAGDGVSWTPGLYVVYNGNNAVMNTSANGVNLVAGRPFYWFVVPPSN